MDEDLRFTYISDRFFEILPVARETVIGRTRQEFAGKALEVPHWQAHYRDLGARKPFRNFEYDVTLPNRELRFLQISGKPVFALDGTFKGYRGPEPTSPSFDCASSSLLPNVNVSGA